MDRLDCSQSADNRIEFKSLAQIEYLPAITDGINEFLENLGVGPKAVVQLDVAIDEIITNIASYAYDENVQGDMDVVCECFVDKRGVKLTFIDEGVEYDPLKKEDPDVTLSSEERQIGGLGIYIVKKTMDSVKYERLGNQNVLTIEKHY